MKKISYSILLIISFIFVNGCSGYKPIFSSANSQFQISDYSIEGDKILGNKIYSKLHKLSKSKKDHQNVRSISLLIDISKDKDATSKDSTGKILEYRITLNTNVDVKDFITKNKILKQTFTSSLTYKTQDQYSNTLDLENKSIENLIDKTFQELFIKLIESIATK